MFNIIVLPCSPIFLRKSPISPFIWVSLSFSLLLQVYKFNLIYSDISLPNSWTKCYIDVCKCTVWCDQSAGRLCPWKSGLEVGHRVLPRRIDKMRINKWLCKNKNKNNTLCLYSFLGIHFISQRSISSGNIFVAKLGKGDSLIIFIQRSSRVRHVIMRCQVFVMRIPFLSLFSEIIHSGAQCQNPSLNPTGTSAHPMKHEVKIVSIGRTPLGRNDVITGHYTNP